MWVFPGVGCPVPGKVQQYINIGGHSIKPLYIGDLDKAGSEKVQQVSEDVSVGWVGFSESICK